MNAAENAAELKDLSRTKLIADVRAVIVDAETYLGASAAQTGEAYAAARKKLERTLATARTQIAETLREFDEKTRAAARATDAYVHERPWESIAVGAGVGLLVGFVLARR
jgi:ElaB/YqjD/DUF883 family membrane-anchored ribosome-binding protein